MWQVVYKKKRHDGTQELSLRDAAGGGERQGRAIVDADSERTLSEEGLNPFDEFNMNAVGSYVNAELTMIDRVKRLRKVEKH